MAENSQARKCLIGGVLVIAIACGVYFGMAKPFETDECASGTHVCSSNAECVPFRWGDFSGYDCNCNPGFAGNRTHCEDIDECGTDAHNCNTAACTNTIGGFYCTCPVGSIDTLGDGTQCDDIDECSNGSANCSINAECINRDSNDMVLDGEKWVQSGRLFECRCNRGFTDALGDGTQCDDVNECDAGTDNCDINAACKNTEGSFECTCDPGYTDTLGNGAKCDDTNECDTDAHNCSINAACTNTIGGFDCTCNTGFTLDTLGDGTQCDDVDECDPNQPAHDCHINGCKNTPGSYVCSCNIGYVGNGLECELGGADIMFDTSVNYIESIGFSRYLIVGGTKTTIDDTIYPPEGATEILMGCGRNDQIETTIQLAAIMTPEEIFDAKDYPNFTPTKAKEIRNFFGYKSTSESGQIGFSGNENIVFNYEDRYDCMEENRCEPGNADKHRLSILPHQPMNIMRCGEYLHGKYDDSIFHHTPKTNPLDGSESFHDFQYLFSLVMYYK